MPHIQLHVHMYVNQLNRREGNPGGCLESRWLYLTVIGIQMTVNPCKVWNLNLLSRRAGMNKLLGHETAIDKCNLLKLYNSAWIWRRILLDAEDDPCDVFLAVCSRWGPTFQDQWLGQMSDDEVARYPQVTPWWAAWSQQVVTSETETRHWHLDKEMRGKSWIWRGNGGWMLVSCLCVQNQGWPAGLYNTTREFWHVFYPWTSCLSGIWHARMNVCGPSSALAKHSSTGLTLPGRPSPDMVVVIIKTEPGPLRNCSVSDTYWAGRCLACMSDKLYLLWS